MSKCQNWGFQFHNHNINTDDFIFSVMFIAVYCCYDIFSTLRQVARDFFNLTVRKSS